MEVKQVIVFRKDLLKGDHSLRKGKIAAQVAHASLGALLKCFNKKKIEPIQLGLIGDAEPGQIFYEYELSFGKDTLLDKWLNGTFTKIVVGIDDEAALLDLKKRIEEANEFIPVCLITDAGNTEFHGVPTVTCLGIGPYDSEDIDKFTKDLPLL